MNIGEVYDVEIEKLTNTGAGLAKINNFVVFVNNTCPEDKVRIKINKVNKSYATADIVEILEPSPHRIKPFCPMQKVCGSCQLQFIDYNYQLELKREIVKDTLRSIGNINIDVPNVIPSPQNQTYRHKIQYPVSETKNSKRILAGYYKTGTHEIVNIKYCPIQPEICDKITEFIRENASEYKISGYCEKTGKGDLRHIVIRNSAANGDNLVVLVMNNKIICDNYKKFCSALFNEFEEVKGVCINLNDKNNNVILGKVSKCMAGEEYIEEKLLDKTFKIGANTFFQVNPKSAENIFSYVKNYISKNFNKPLVLDAYAGISAFGICVSDVCSNVVTIEENSEAVELAKITAKHNSVENIEINGGDTAKYFEHEKRKFDAIILDPPRKGCSELSLNEAVRLSNDTIIYVSCNPATLARDLKYLTEQKGCKLVSVQPFDMFCHTYHIENVAIIKV